MTVFGDGRFGDNTFGGTAVVAVPCVDVLVTVNIIDPYAALARVDLIVPNVTVTEELVCR